MRHDFPSIRMVINQKRSVGKGGEKGELCAAGGTASRVVAAPRRIKSRITMC